ncbi:hypothetical protein ElyMa_006780000 [Elysia marginata]|uniref:Peptidase M12B propeptide domain-containing protein n=1 Tax=Elysia marginata TaxID=1093978 RepID=A0AAV4J1J2_9GAST|nr:hypothetical protein ElyMa_006780000 [Elysia marginata]
MTLLLMFLLGAATANFTLKPESYTRIDLTDIASKMEYHFNIVGDRYRYYRFGSHPDIIKIRVSSRLVLFEVKNVIFRKTACSRSQGQRFFAMHGVHGMSHYCDLEDGNIHLSYGILSVYGETPMQLLGMEYMEIDR